MSDDAAFVFPNKHPSAVLDYAVDFESECARTWSKWTDYALNDCIRVYQFGSASGLEWKATTAGRSAGRPPNFPTVVGQTVKDGSVIWTAQALSTSSLVRTISGTPVWTADSGITAANATISGMVAIADLSGGVDGQDYSVTVIATMSDGNAVPKVCILPVRIPRRCG